MGDNIFSSLRESAEWIKEMEHESWLGTAALQIEAADAIQQRDAEIERLRAAGDALAEAVDDTWWPDYPSDFPDLLAAWKEARREQ